jgi:hypothetical protein
MLAMDIIVLLLPLTFYPQAFYFNCSNGAIIDLFMA